MQKPIKKTATKDLETALDRTKKALKNAKLKPLSPPNKPLRIGSKRTIQRA